MKSKTFHIQTMGCQMNVYDSEQMARLLAKEGLTPTSDIYKADIVILNTCTIREKPEHKVFSQLGRFVKLKKKNHRVILVVAGCVAQQEERNIQKKAPHVDIVLGTFNIGHLTTLVEQVENEKIKVLSVEDDICQEPRQIEPAAFEKGRATAFVTIMTGCDNFCTYCVVPYVRGREKSRDADRILEEIRLLVDSGVREVTLLGQNVNSYGQSGGHAYDFPALLKAVSGVDGLQRIRFTTSHPKDLSDGLVEAFSSLEKLASHIHLPVQSGSDRILKRMNRGYTRHMYLEKIQALRKACPHISITSDMIVGFPGEELKDFHETLELMDTVQFDNLFAFKYSDRRDVPSSRFSQKVDEEEKKERLAVLLEKQAHTTLKKNQALVGSVQEVLVEGVSKKKGGQVTGHTPCNRTVNFSSDTVRVGEMVPIRIVEGLSHSLLGRLDMSRGGWSDKKGGILHAA